MNRFLGLRPLGRFNVEIESGAGSSLKAAVRMVFGSWAVRSMLSMHGRLARPWLWVPVAFALHGSSDLLAQSDDFEDGNDAGWTRYSPLTVLGAPVTFSFPNDGQGGKAYRLQCPAPLVSEFGPARALSYRPEVHADFFAAVDLMGWDNELHQALGFVFRGDNIGLGTTTGYILNYNTQQAAGGRGQLQINRVAGERDTGTIGSANITLDTNRRYRLVLTTVGADFFARIYDFLDLTAPLAAFPANDSTSSRGAIGLFNYNRTSAVIDPAAGRTDATFDNYLVTAQPSVAVPLPGTPHGVLHMPQVVNRSPASRASFYPAAKGLGFTATTLTTNRVNTNAIRLFLNGADVSAKLTVSGSSSNANATFGGLTANTIYEGRIILEDFAGRRSTNEWTFDTLTEEFLNSAEVKVIEAEDYNYEGGKFQDNPPVSGLTGAGALVNGNGVGYYDLIGVPEVDYFDASSNPGSGAAPEYRSADFVGTQAGSVESGGAGQANPRQNDTPRQKYAMRGLPEYQVRRTEGGEWMNYTRNFASGDYNVYLRAAGRAPQPVLLSRVTSDRTKPNQTTSSLGVFQVPNTGLIVNYRFVPLTDDSGKPAVVKLSALETLRLTMGGPQDDSTQHTMTLNSLLFVPASSAPPEIQLESAASVTGPFAVDSAAVVDSNRSAITVPASGNYRFYRLRADSFLPMIRSVRVVNGIVTIEYSGVR